MSIKIQAIGMKAVKPEDASQVILRCEDPPVIVVNYVLTPEQAEQIGQQLLECAAAMRGNVIVPGNAHLMTRGAQGGN